ncbi:MAG: DUF4912 domain-containing protein [Treponema sp.]|jgi:hypothetical protein|nr:DUF4912 domain-containing protein [Treponema sp.]
MSNQILPRSQLEAMISADLLALADEYGIDVPENLNRRFIIAGLLEAMQEQYGENPGVAALAEAANRGPPELPKTYNETVIAAILRNPVWLYIYWDISAVDLAIIRSSRRRQGLLTITMLDGGGKPLSGDSFAIPLSIDSREQHVRVPEGKRAVRVELAVNEEPEKRRVLAVLPKVPLPENTLDFPSLVTKKNIPPMLALSGFQEILRGQYLRHRQFTASPEG